MKKIEHFCKRIRDKIIFYCKDRKKFSVRKYDVIFSFGYACSTALFMKTQGLRKFSAPMDWTSGASFDARCTLFLNKFKDFIKKDDIFHSGEIFSGNEHRMLYKSKTSGIIFVHDFNVGDDFEKEYPKVEEKYARRINRLINKIENTERTLLIYMDYPSQQCSVATDDEIRDFIKKANEVYNKEHIDILYIRHNEEMPDGEFTIKNLSENAIVAECYNRIRNAEGETTGCEKNARRILQFFRLK